MWQGIVSARVFPAMVAAIGLVMVGNTAFAQSGAVLPKTLSAGDSLLIKELYFRGIQQKSTGQLVAAENTFDKLVQLQPGSDAAHFELARIYAEREDYVAAARAAKRAAAVNPDNEWYWSLLLEIYQKTADVKAMTLVFDELIRLQPDKASHYHDKAFALYLDKQYAASLAVYDTIVDRFGEADDHYLTRSQIHLAQGDTQLAIGELEALIFRKPTESKGYILLAELYTKTRQARKAITLLDGAGRLFPKEPLIMLSKADAYRAMGKQKQAYDFLRQAFVNDSLDFDAKAGILYAAIGTDQRRLAEASLLGLADLMTEHYPREAKAHAVRGDIYMQLRHPDQARQAYLNALDINRYIDGFWQQLLQVELQMGRFGDVEAHGKEALTVFPNHPVLLFFTGHGFLGNRNYQEARHHLEQALNHADGEHTPLLAQLYSNLGDTYHALEMHAASDVAYEEAIALDSTNAYALNNYAYYLALRNEKLDLAAELSKKSIAITPDYASYEDTYAWILFRQGNYAEALVWIEKAIKHSDEVSGTLLEHYGDILAKSGDINKAIVQWRKARAISESVGKDIDKLSQKIDAKQFID